VLSTLIENEENTSPTQFYAYQTIRYRPVKSEIMQQTMVGIVHA
jgi:hypothetical protein